MSETEREKQVKETENTAPEAIPENDTVPADRSADVASDSNSSRNGRNGKKRMMLVGIIAVAVVLAAILIGIGIYNTPTNRMNRHMDLGARYLEEQNYEQAVVEFDKVIAIDPMSVEAYLGKAEAYEGMGDTDKALETLQTGYEKTGDNRLLELMQPIEWQDAAFESLIREYLGKPEGEIRGINVCNIREIQIYGIYIIMPDEECSYTTLGMKSYSFRTDKRECIDETQRGQIRSLEDLRHFKSLRVLEINNNPISDISVLSGLTNLKQLYLSGNQISDISGLSGLTNLEALSLGFNQISDISALSGLTNLEYLNLGNNPISDISVLSGLTNLEVLYLHGNQISDISALSGLTNLKDLLLSVNQISDISALSGLTNLERLWLGDNQISDISALSGLTKLENLRIENNQISDISALSGLTNLEYLDLRDNPISDYSPVSFVEDLQY